MAQKTKGSGTDGRTTRHSEYELSQRSAGEEAIGGGKTIALMAKVMYVACRVRYAFTFAMAAYNLVRIPRLLVPTWLRTRPTNCPKSLADAPDGSNVPPSSTAC